MERAGEIKVWDLFVRIFHWTLVVGFFIAYLSEEDMIGLHVWSGYLVFSLVLLRVTWGFIGSLYARFSDFVYGPGEIVRYVSQVISFRAPRHFGHNPAGGAMIVLLLMCLFVTAFTGMVLYGVETQSGVLGHLASLLGVIGEQGEEIFEDMHEFFANLTVVLVVIHVGGVIYESLLHKENLVRSMFTGYKKL